MVAILQKYDPKGRGVSCELGFDRYFAEADGDASVLDGSAGPVMDFEPDLFREVTSRPRVAFADDAYTQHDEYCIVSEYY